MRSVRFIRKMYEYRFTALKSVVTFCGAMFLASAAAQDAGIDVNSDYILGNGDRIAIQVFDEPDLTMELQVSASGVINYSYVGTVEVAGQTPKQIEEQITQILADGYLINPSVNVNITQYRPFFVNGEVRNPGGYAYQPGLTVARAIALAGGLTDRASKRKMYLVEGGSSNNDRVRVDMDRTIEPGDVITIDEGFF